MVEGVSNPTHVYAKMVMAVKIVVENFALHLVKMEEAALVRTRVAALWDMSAYGVKK